MNVEVPIDVDPAEGVADPPNHQIPLQINVPYITLADLGHCPYRTYTGPQLLHVYECPVCVSLLPYPRCNHPCTVFTDYPVYDGDTDEGFAEGPNFLKEWFLQLFRTPVSRLAIVRCSSP